MLKSDLHLHTGEDPDDGFYIKYSAKDLIRFMAKKGFEVISIANHNQRLFSKELCDYAKRKGLLLIPGAEKSIDGKHVLLHNINDSDLKKVKALGDIERINDQNTLVTAPHPFFIAPNCLGTELIQNIKLFDAIEYSHFYTRFWNLNRKAVKVADEYDLPLLGSSDSHRLETVGTTYSMIDADKDVDSVLEAIRKNRIDVMTKPVSVSYMARIVACRFFVEPVLKPRK